MSNFIKVAESKDIAPGEAKTVKAKDREIAIYSVGGKIYATESGCPHRGGPLGEGYLEGRVITCPWHGWRFDVISGATEVNPDVRIKSYDVKQEGNDILVKLED